MSDKKQLVVTAMTELIGNADLEAVGRMLSDDFVEHNPQVATATKQGWLDSFRGFPLQAMRIDIRELIAEDCYVTMFSRRWLPDGRVIAVADLFRFDGDLIAEHWEVVQPIDADDDNPLELLGTGIAS